MSRAWQPRPDSTNHDGVGFQLVLETNGWMALRNGLPNLLYLHTQSLNYDVPTRGPPRWFPGSLSGALPTTSTKSLYLPASVQGDRVT